MFQFSGECPFRLLVPRGGQEADVWRSGWEEMTPGKLKIHSSAHVGACMTHAGPDNDYFKFMGRVWGGVSGLFDSRF